jgi:Leucine-rich repeat (LRR) protein
LPTLPPKLEELGCCGNELTGLPTLPPKLIRLFCSDNNLSSLPTTLPQNLTTLHCSSNKLIMLPTSPENIIYGIKYINNPIYEIVNNNYSLVQTRQNIQILNNFRHLYYCLKFKKQLRKWLWEKVRHPRIMRNYHPNHLVQNLSDDDDLDAVLNNWK